MYNIDTNWVKEKLISLPEQIAKQQHTLIDMQLEYARAESEYNHQYAQALLKAKADGYNDSAAKLVAADNTREAALKLAEKEIALSRQKAVVENLENRFTAVRKIANLLESEIKRFGG